MKIFITGAGLVGIYVALEASLQGHGSLIYEIKPDRRSINAVYPEAKIITGDVTDMPHLEKVILEYNPEVIVHTAAIRQRAAKADPDLANKINVQGTKNIVNVAKKNGIKLVHISSDTVYGLNLNTEKPIDENFPLNPDTIYAKTKMAGEEIAREYSNSTILRLTSLFGPWPGSASTFNGIVRKIIASGLEEKDIKLEVPFPPQTEQLYVKDLVKAILLAATNNQSRRTYNVGAGSLMSYSDLESVMANVFNISVKLSEESQGLRMQAVRSFSLDTTLVSKELGYKPTFTPQEAIKDYINVMKSWPAELRSFE